jgi:D-glycerate 3-kinase
LFLQAELRKKNPGNALLEVNAQHFYFLYLFFSLNLWSWLLVCIQYRGNAGSHDLKLSVETLEALSKLTKEGLFHQ